MRAAGSGQAEGNGAAHQAYGVMGTPGVMRQAVEIREDPTAGTSEQPQLQPIGTWCSTYNLFCTPGQGAPDNMVGLQQTPVHLCAKLFAPMINSSTSLFQKGGY